MLGRIERVALREVWRHEALDFTRWLEQNVDELNGALDFTLATVQREGNVGDFSVDLLGSDSDGEVVVIENQLERSDHDHLGKLITYLAVCEAKRAVWIVAEPRPEHIRAVAWLNTTNAAAFYLVKLEAVRIDESPPAPLFTLITGPTPENGITRRRDEVTERDRLRFEFWSQHLARAKERTALHSGVSPSYRAYSVTGAGMAGLAYVYGIARDYAGIELYINRVDPAENARIFEALRARQKEIEDSFGEPLDWEPLEGKRACRISKYWEEGGYLSDRSEWPNIQDRMIDGMIRFEQALRPLLRALPTAVPASA